MKILTELSMKDIIGYLPYKLAAVNCDSEIIWIDYAFVEKHGMGLDGYIPLLLPISYINREIINRGEKFKPMDRIHAISNSFKNKTCGIYTDSFMDHESWQEVFDILNECRIDYRHLIGYGFARDAVYQYNRFKNPYESL